MTTTHPKRRFFRYSLRTMFVVVTVFCVWLTIIVNRARDQKWAVDAVLELGGEVIYEHQWGVSGPPGPEWLRRFIGDEYFFSVYRVDLDNTKADDTTLASIKRFTDLEHLTLRDNQITDAGLEHLKGLTNLYGLDLSNTKITDAGLMHLKGLTNLQLLSLDNTKITNDWLVHLK